MQHLADFQNKSMTSTLPTGKHKKKYSALGLCGSEWHMREDFISLKISKFWMQMSGYRPTLLFHGEICFITGSELQPDKTSTV